MPASPSRLTSILSARDGCQTTLDEVEGLLDRYPSFSVNRKRRIELLKFITRDVEALKVKLSNNTQLLQISLASLTMYFTTPIFLEGKVRGTDILLGCRCLALSRH